MKILVQWVNYRAQTQFHSQPLPRQCDRDAVNPMRATALFGQRAIVR